MVKQSPQQALDVLHGQLVTLTTLRNNLPLFRLRVLAVIQICGFINIVVLQLRGDVIDELLHQVELLSGKQIQIELLERFHQLLLVSEAFDVLEHLQHADVLGVVLLIVHRNRLAVGLPVSETVL